MKQSQPHNLKLTRRILIAHGYKALHGWSSRFVILQLIEQILEAQNFVDDGAVLEIDWWLPTSPDIQNGDPAEVALFPQSIADRWICYRKYRVHWPIEFMERHVISIPIQFTIHRRRARAQFDRRALRRRLSGNRRISINSPPLVGGIGVRASRSIRHNGWFFRVLRRFQAFINRRNFRLGRKRPAVSVEKGPADFFPAAAPFRSQRRSVRLVHADDCGQTQPTAPVPAEGIGAFVASVFGHFREFLSRQCQVWDAAAPRTMAVRERALLSLKARSLRRQNRRIGNRPNVNL